QACVVTLEPVAARVEDSFALLYGAAEEEGAEEVVLSGEVELVEPLPDRLLDIGEVVAQQLSLALDPYPRAPGAVAEAPQEGLASPFAALAKWRKTR
ncbi:MAG TPA: YceD family protein, partial [Stellaceae bacterium]